MTSPSTSNAHQVIIQRLLDNLPVGYTTASVKLPNRHFDTPTNDKWLRVTIINQDVNNVQAGGLWKRYDALIAIDCFYPLGDDTLQQIDDCEIIAKIYENQNFGGASLDDVKCTEALVSTEGEDGAWYNIQTIIEATYEGYQN